MARALGWLLPSLLLLPFCSCAQTFLRRRTRGEPLSTGNHPTDAWFLQKLDHFSNKRSPFWPQRYFINDTFYKPGGPVFLFIEGEIPASREWISSNYAWMTYARRLGALCLLLEHRFYGYSQPTGNLSTASLRYLSSRQALADIANFRTRIARKMGLTKNKWVTFGGSYGGSLAVWSRMKYPNLFAAAVGSSAPVQAKVNYYEYLEVIQKILVTYSSECSKAVKNAADQIVETLEHPTNYTKLEKDFMLCEPLANDLEMDKAYFIEILIYFFETTIQNKKTNKASQVEDKDINIGDFCEMMANTSLGSPYDRYARFINTVLKKANAFCLSASYNFSIEHYSDPILDDQNLKKERQWLYQCCTEFGFFLTTDSKKQPFSGLPLRYFFQKCSDIFGPEFNNVSVSWGVLATNRYSDGLNMKGSKIIFPNCSLDPWHPLGITKDISKDLPAVFIKGEGHCADMQKPKHTDSAELIQAREKILKILLKWLK